MNWWKYKEKLFQLDLSFHQLKAATSRNKCLFTSIHTHQRSPFFVSSVIPSFRSARHFSLLFCHWKTEEKTSIFWFETSSVIVADTLTVNVSVLLLSLASPDESSLVSLCHLYVFFSCCCFCPFLFACYFSLFVFFTIQSVAIKRGENLKRDSEMTYGNCEKKKPKRIWQSHHINMKMATLLFHNATNDERHITHKDWEIH